MIERGFRVPCEGCPSRHPLFEPQNTGKPSSSVEPCGGGPSRGASPARRLLAPSALATPPHSSISSADRLLTPRERVLLRYWTASYGYLTAQWWGVFLVVLIVLPLASWFGEYQAKQIAVRFRFGALLPVPEASLRNFPRDPPIACGAAWRAHRAR